MLEKMGYDKALFPFNSTELSIFEQCADQINNLELEQRKNVFALYPKLRVLVNQALLKCGLKLITTNYCFYIEKNISQNWPLALHQDLNFPSYLDEDQDQDLQKSGVWFRLNLDKSDQFSGALKVIPKSHLDSGEKEISFLNNEAGEVILFKPLLFHGSNKMTHEQRRRVFQVLCKKI
ncbi:phytanoyl-CoA dioxygenase family protein [Lentisphaera marina]|uniref:phytanoyl-CoA dioxygenase family protein n=1 Tax=Lentisphaera marina TaxID=1111041 RepID=UPI0023657EA9|nr:phytanoyl-CoA dioxygenase family protein [Lentisphaera marina]MDD7987534.1 phytanoyl-CoA dioxygenase family protein [Lentisphaera marina]